MHTITGHHHISMLTKSAKENNRFYQQVLGMRRVKKTVNQDNPSMYHLFYGDRTGSAGTELSFFELPAAGRTIRGTNAITGIGLLVPSKESLVYWKDRLEAYEVKHEAITTYAGREALPFDDPDGLRLILLNNNRESIPEFWQPWESSPVPDEHRILGMGTTEMTVRNLDALAELLTVFFGYTEASRTNQEAIFQAVPGQGYGEILVKPLDGPKERPGRGSVHHLAIRVKDDSQLSYWNERLIEKGFRTSGIIDRYYFKSLYVRETNGILFEIATDGPGFTADASVETLGQHLDLPPFLENKRLEIEAQLQPID